MDVELFEKCSVSIYNVSHPAFRGARSDGADKEVARAWTGLIRVVERVGAPVVELLDMDSERRFADWPIAVLAPMTYDGFSCSVECGSPGPPLPHTPLAFVFARAGIAVKFKACVAQWALTDEKTNALQALRRIVGPHASETKLRKHVRGGRDGDDRKAANCYLRDVCSDARLPFDFQLRRFAPRVLSIGRLERSAGVCAAQVQWIALESHLFPAAVHLCLDDIGALMTTSQQLYNRVTNDGQLWALKFRQTFARADPDTMTSPLPVDPDIATTQVPSVSSSSSGTLLLPGTSSVSKGKGKPKDSGAPPRLPRSQAFPDASPPLRIACSASAGAYVRFVRQWDMESRRICPACKMEDCIIPVVHGFPSPALVTHFRQGRIMLTENCGVLGAPWLCRHCRTRWYHYPYVSGITEIPTNKRDPNLPLVTSHATPPMIESSSDVDEEADDTDLSESLPSER
eukprot:TRINITY_DN72828_c0_g1_i1.p1 TRINITY_DN72828_c0_g1~~TRINITY_DN72828_c0_g1_i1.p1  ORF type:complete len:458 (-),score=31.04 TRINITY_DN72828_c0_g1_i1:164-1537(-)